MSEHKVLEFAGENKEQATAELVNFKARKWQEHLATNNITCFGAQLAVETLDIDEDMGKRLESIVYSKADRSIDGMEQNLDYLGVVIGLAPMLGLLGTITGMISSFNALNERAQNPMAVTAGIGEALITTVFGLCIAIMGMCIYAYLSSKVKTASLNINEVASVVVDIVQAKNGSSKN